MLILAEGWAGTPPLANSFASTERGSAESKLVMGDEVWWCLAWWWCCEKAEDVEPGAPTEESWDHGEALSTAGSMPNSGWQKVISVGMWAGAVGAVAAVFRGALAGQAEVNESMEAGADAGNEPARL